LSKIKKERVDFGESVGESEFSVSLWSSLAPPASINKTSFLHQHQSTKQVCFTTIYQQNKLAPPPSSNKTSLLHHHLSTKQACSTTIYQQNKLAPPASINKTSFLHHHQSTKQVCFTTIYQQNKLAPPLSINKTSLLHHHLSTKQVCSTTISQQNKFAPSPSINFCRKKIIKSWDDLGPPSPLGRDFYKDSLKYGQMRARRTQNYHETGQIGKEKRTGENIEREDNIIRHSRTQKAEEKKNWAIDASGKKI
jgi:hypothetical protein